MRYSDHLDHLRILIISLGNSKQRRFKVESLAKELSLDPQDVNAALCDFPTIFRRWPPINERERPLHSLFSVILGPLWRAARRWVRPPQRIDEDVEYSLQVEDPDSADAVSKASDDRPARREEVERLLHFVETSAESENAGRRTRTPAVIVAAVALLIALFLSSTGQSLVAGAAGLTLGGAGLAFKSTGEGQSASLPSLNVTCGTCGRATRQVEPPAQGGGGGAGGGDWIRAILLAGGIGLGVAFLLPVWRGSGPAPFLTLSSALSFASGVAVWAQPALTVKATEEGLHNPTAAVLLVLVVLAFVLLVSGYLFRSVRLRWLWCVPALATLSLFLSLPLATASSRANIRADFLAAYLAASGPERLYAWVLIVFGLLGLLASAAIGRWLSRSKG